jgi:hypothetical protein
LCVQTRRENSSVSKHGMETCENEREPIDAEEIFDVRTCIAV